MYISYLSSTTKICKTILRPVLGLSVGFLPENPYVKFFKCLQVWCSVENWEMLPSGDFFYNDIFHLIQEFALFSNPVYTHINEITGGH